MNQLNLRKLMRSDLRTLAEQFKHLSFYWHLKNSDSNPWPLWRRRNASYEATQLRPGQSVGLISPVNVHSFHESNTSREHMSPTNWPAPNWVGLRSSGSRALQRHRRGSNPFETFRWSHLIFSSVYRWFSITWRDGHVGAQNNSKLWLMFFIIRDSNSQKTFFSIVLYTNMAAVTSGENHL